MQNKTNLNTHNEIISNEPWHRGSGFTWMLLALAGAVFLFSGVVAKAGDIWDGYVQINGTWYNVGGANNAQYSSNTGGAQSAVRGAFNNQNFGTITYGNFGITGFSVMGWTSFGETVGNGGVNYKIWKNGTTEPGYSNYYTLSGGNYAFGNNNYNQNYTAQTTQLIGADWINGDTYNLKTQSFTTISGTGKWYEATASLIINGARQLYNSNSDATQSTSYNTSSAGGLVKQGTGNLTLAVDNSNSSTGQKGDIYIDAGTISVNPNAGVSGNSALGSSGTVVRLGAESGTGSAGFALTKGDGGLDIGRQIVIRKGSSGTKTISSSNTSGINTISGTISLDDNVTISGATGSGTLDLTGKFEDGLATGTYGVLFSSGTVRLSGGTDNTGVNLYTVANGATLRMNKTSADSIQSTLTVNNGGIAELSAANQLGAAAVVNNNGTFATGGNNDSFGTLNSSGNITGNGTLTATTYNITGGTVDANLGTGTLNASGGANIKGSAAAGTMNVTGNATLTGTSAATAVVVTNSGTTLTLGTGANRLSTSADVTLDTGTAISIADNQSVVMLREAGTGRSGTASIAAGKTLTITGNQQGLKYMNSISGDGGLTMSGDGDTDLRLFGDQSYKGATTVTGGKLSTKVGLASTSISVSGGEFATVTDGGSTGSILDTATVNVSGGKLSLAANDTVGSFTISGGEVAGSTLTAATYVLNGGTVSANLGAGAATASTGTTALNGNLGGSLTASGGTVNAAGTIGGNVTVNGGTVNLSAADRISNTSAVSISSGTLGLGANNDTVGSLSISGGTLGGSGKLTASTYGLSGGTVNANLGAGTVNANSGTTALNGTVDATTINVGGGTLNLGSGGRLAAGATANVSSGTLSTGGNETITRLNATGGTVNLTGDTLTVTGTGGNASSIGSSVTATGGTISVQGALDYQASSGSTALSVASGGTLSGSGTTSGTLSVGGKLAPGNSTGVMNVGSTTFLGGGSYAWEIDTFGSGAVVGTNWDFLNITGSLTISASSGSQFLIDIISLLSTNDTAGPASGFNLASNYSFAIATASGGISGFDVAAFAINTSGFQNSMGAGNPLYVSAGSWSVSQSGNNLMLNYTGAVAIPEPSVASMFLLGLSALLVNRRRRA